MDGFAPVRVSPRKPSELQVVILRPEPRVGVEFMVPDRVTEAEIESLAQVNFSQVQKTPALLERYGLNQQALTLQQVEGLRETLLLIEAAARLWKRWNIILPGDDDISEITPQNIAMALEDQMLRSVWGVYYASSITLDFSEGNVSASSLHMNSGEEANIADGASRSTPPAAEASPEAPVPTAPGSITPPEQPTES